MVYSFSPPSVIDAAHVADKDHSNGGIIGTMRTLNDQIVLCTLGRAATLHAIRSWYCIVGPSKSKMPSSTASMDAGIVAVHRHQGFGSPAAYAISHFAPGRRHSSGHTLVAPLKISSNEEPFAMLARSASVSRPRPPPRASSAWSCKRQSSSSATPTKTECHSVNKVQKSILSSLRTRWEVIDK